MTAHGTIRQWAKIWDAPGLQHYTRHGVDHSGRIRAWLEEILPLLTSPLTDNDPFILLNAVYLHNIGMQHARYAFGDVVPSDPAELDKLRTVHNHASAAWILSDGRGLPMLRPLALYDDDYLDLIALVARPTFRRISPHSPRPSTAMASSCASSFWRRCSSWVTSSTSTRAAPTWSD